MKPILKRSSLALLFFALLLSIIPFTACKKKTRIPFNPAFASYISAYTTGNISVGSTIRIRLTDAFVGEVNAQVPVSEKLLTFSPSIEGQLFWVDNQTLEYRPNKELPRGQIYEATLRLDKITQVPGEMAKFNFDFAVMRQHMEVSIDNIRPYSNDSLGWMQLSGKVTTLDVCDPQALPNVLTATEGGMPLSIQWLDGSNSRIHYFIVDSIARTQEDQKVKIKWDGSAIDASQSGELEQEIPSLNRFAIMRTTVVQQPEQYIQVLFSDPLQSAQIPTGLMDLPSVYSERFAVESNEVRVYPSYRLTGLHTLHVSEGIKSIRGFALGTSMDIPLEFEDLKPQITIDDQQRTILPSTEGLVFPFKAVNLSAVDVRVLRIFESNVPQFLQVNDLADNYQMRRVGRTIKYTTVHLNDDGNKDLAVWNTFYLNLNEIIQPEPGAIYRIELSMRKQYSLYPCSDESPADNMYEVNAFDAKQMNDDVPTDAFSYYYEYDDYYEDYDYAQRNNPCDIAYYHAQSTVGKNILASDIGMIAKRGNDDALLVVTSDLKTTKPLRDIEIEVLNLQQQVLATAKTDNNGMALFENLKEVPFLVVAKHGKQRGYLKVDQGHALNLSAFDIIGEQSQQGLKGMLYGERGVWRPGDSLFLTFILEDEKKVLPPIHPVVFELINSRGQMVHKMVRSKSQNGFFNFTCQTSPDAPTGNYQANVRVGGAVFSKTLKIETVKPNRLKMQLDFGTTQLSAMDNNTVGNLDVKWLHGAIAKQLKTTISATFTSTTTQFDRFKDYVFTDPTRHFYPEEQVVLDATTNQEGHVQFPLKPEFDGHAPGMLNAAFGVKVFEPGGDFSVDRFTMPYAPYPAFVGVKVPQPQEANAYALETDKNHTIKIASVDAKGKPIAIQGLKWKLYKIQWRWWWERSDNDLSNYAGSESNNTVMEGTLNTDAQGQGAFQIQVKYPEWGQYLVHIEDPQGGHATGQTLYIDWPTSMSREGRQNPEGATMLAFSLDKPKYTKGESCTVTFPSSENSRALISIENSSGVIEAKWIDTKKGETQYSFTTNERMTPNAYIHISLVQPHSQTINDLPIRLYGVMPVFVENQDSHLQPVITMANELEPNQNFEVKITEKEGKAMTYTLAIVDEGLLDLTRFKTPDPWQHFYAREALGVNTFDLYDQVIGAYGSKLEKLLSLGGSDEINQKGKNRANRFTPVVMYCEPVTIEKGKSHTHKLKMPNYVGAVRVMVVAGKEMAYGNAEKSVPVKKPLMVLASLPRVVGPGEEIKLPVTVFAMDKNIKEVNVAVEPNSFFVPLADTRSSVSFSQPGDEVVNFPMRIAEKIGVGKIKVTLTAGNQKAYYETEIEVRNPNPVVNKVWDGVVESGESWSLDFDLVGIAGTNQAALEITAMPPVDFGSRLRYLMDYPHGCLEQTTSSVFPQLYLSDVMELPAAEQEKTSANIKAGIQRIATFQLRSGGMSYWPGSSKEDEWATTYAGHFMIEAKTKGFVLPNNWENAWVNYQKQKAQQWSPSTQRGVFGAENELIQAYRLYTLALAGKSEMGAMNRLKEYKDLSIAAKWRLAAAYLLAGQSESAKALIQQLSTSVAPYSAMGYSYGSNTRDEAMIIETLTLLKDRSKAAPLVKNIAEKLSTDQWYSTQTTAYALIAISKFAANSGGNNLHYNYAFNGKWAEQKIAKPFASEKLALNKIKGNKVEVKNSGSQVLFVRLINSGQSMVGSEVADSKQLNIQLRFLDMKGQSLDVSHIQQGTDFVAEVSIHNPGMRGMIKDLALTQIFPSGWEIINDRLDASAMVMNSSQPDYRDVRDDRVFSYFDLHPNSTKTFRVKLNASYLGRYYLPATSCEAMYDNGIYARTAGQWVEVVESVNRTAMK